MEKRYPTLKRPNRKLCYVNLTKKECPPNQWLGVEPLSLGEIDKIFDDLDPSSHSDDADPLPSPTSSKISESLLNQSEEEAPTIPQQEGRLTQKNSRCQKGFNEDVLHPATRSPSLEPDIGLDSPFTAHRPVKTSSPIEENMIVKGAEELDIEKHKALPPIHFACEDEGKEEARTEHLPSQKPQCNGEITQRLPLVLLHKIDDSELESPPRKVVLSKPTVSSHKNKVEGPCKESHPVKEITPEKITADLEGKRKTPREEKADPPMAAVRQEPAAATSEKKSEGAHRQPPVKGSTRVEKDMTTFLKKLREAIQPKPSCSRKSLSPVKVPNPPEPEDDFLILEDDTPFIISIPSKSATNKKLSKSSSTDKDSSTHKEAKDAPLVSAQKQQESEQANSKPGSQNVNQKMKTKEKGKNEVTGPGFEMDEFCAEELSAGDSMEPEKPNKKKQRLNKLPSKQSDKAEDQPEDAARGEVDNDKNTRKKEKKAEVASDMKRSVKVRSENGKTSTVKSFKGGRKGTQGSGAVKETVCVEPVMEHLEQSSKEHPDDESLDSFSDKDMSSDAQMNEKDKQTQQTAVTEESSSDDGQIIGRRKRRKPGRWWFSSSPEDTEETQITDNKPTLKKFKRKDKEPNAAALSPEKTKKDKVLKRRNQIPPSPSPSPSSSQNTEEQQPEVPDPDLDPFQSSPLVLAHRDHSLQSGDQVFQRVYHPASHENMSGTPARDPSGSREQLGAGEPEKRKRKPPHNWWKVKDASEDVQSVPLQNRQQESKPPKERKKKSKNRSSGLGVPKNGNVASSFKPKGGTPVSPLIVNLFPTPKTTRGSPSTFKDVLASASKRPTVVSSRDAGPDDDREVTAGPAVEVTVTDCTTHSKNEEHILSSDAGVSNSPVNHETPQSSKRHSDNMLRSIRSGPSSMIELEPCEENDDLILPSTRVHDVLSASDLCAPPLKPLILQPKDKANLTEWFQSLWSTTADKAPTVTPDQFDWYFHQGRAIGFLVDLNCGFICNGKMLLGSYMKKPLWVDHSSTTVFNILTSSLSVVINGCETHYNPGQSFMVPCGHAYSIQNLMSQPAVLYFTRIFVESSD